MAKIDSYIPEPSPVYSAENQRQILESLTTTKQQLNTSFQDELKQEVERFTWFING